MRPKKEEKDKQNNRLSSYFTDAEIAIIKKCAASKNCKKLSEFGRVELLKVASGAYEQRPKSLQNDVDSDARIAEKAQIVEDFKKVMAYINKAVLEQRAVRSELSPVVNNLNQIAHKLNKSEAADTSVLHKDILWLISKIETISKMNGVLTGLILRIENPER